MTKETHTNLVRCVLNNMGECLAKVPMACTCAKMPKALWEEILDAEYAKDYAEDQDNLYR